MLDKIVKIGLLFDFYGKLLTDKQQEIMLLYYYDDLSLGEIAERLDISRQGVYDHLQRGEELLHAYEKKLGLVARYQSLRNKIDELEMLVAGENINDEKKKNLAQKIKEIKNIL